MDHEFVKENDHTLVREATDTALPKLKEEVLSGYPRHGYLFIDVNNEVSACTDEYMVEGKVFREDGTVAEDFGKYESVVREQGSLPSADLSGVIVIICRKKCSLRAEKLLLRMQKTEILLFCSCTEMIPAAETLLKKPLKPQMKSCQLRILSTVLICAMFSTVLSNKQLTEVTLFPIRSFVTSVT